MSDESTAVARRPTGTSIGKRARGAFDPGQLELIRQTVASECNDAELGMFLELCVRYELDPFAREIWVTKIKGKVVIIIARDGLLQIANRSGEFRGIQGDVVREKDEFRKSSLQPLPDHSYSHMERGDIVGAWAVAHRTGREPTYFYANFEEYKQDKTDYSPWKKQTSAMILKCAESMALRKAFSISGVVGEDEMHHAKLVNGAAAELEDAVEIEWGDDPSIAAWLPLLFEAVNQERPGAWMPAKIRLKLRGKTDAEREELAEVLVKNLVDVGARVPQRLSAEDLEARENAIEGEVIQDAEVVSDDEPPVGYVPPEPDPDEPQFGEPEQPELDGSSN